MKFALASAVLFLSLTATSGQLFPDEAYCKGKLLEIKIGSPDDPLKVHFECETSASGISQVTKCSLNNVAVNAGGKDKVIALDNGNKYKLTCWDYFPPEIQERFATRICKTTEKKASIAVSRSADKIDVKFKCNLLNTKISKCIPTGKEEGFPASDASQGTFGGVSGRKYIISCNEMYTPFICEDYSAERCFSQTKFVDSIPVSGSAVKIDVEFGCIDGKITECRPPNSEKVVKPFLTAVFKKENARFKIDCFEKAIPWIRAISA